MPLVIRAEQMALLDAEAVAKFEDRTLEHVRKHFPAHLANCGEPAVRSTIRLGLERARAHGVRSEPAVRSYIDHMFMMGSFFDEDPQVPWAREILTDTSRPNEYDRMDALHARTMTFLDEAAGENARFMFKAIARARQNRMDPGIDAMPAERADALIAWMRRLYPEKSAAIGIPRASALVRTADVRGAGAGLTTPRGRGAFIGFAHLLGAGFDRDPLLPWAGGTLERTAGKADAGRIDALLAEAEAFAAGFIEWESRSA